jgi:hypothetical protein
VSDSGRLSGEFLASLWRGAGCALMGRPSGLRHASSGPGQQAEAGGDDARRPRVRSRRSEVVISAGPVQPLALRERSSV